MTKPHYRKDLTAEEIAAGKTWGVDFWRRFGHLQNLGLVSCVEYLFDGPEGEPIHPVAEGGESIERSLYESCEAAAIAMLTEGQQAHNDCSIVVPVQAHIEHAQVFGIARLHYRPHTSLTSTWWAEHCDRCSKFNETYLNLTERMKVGFRRTA